MAKLGTISHLLLAVSLCFIGSIAALRFHTRDKATRDVVVTIYVDLLTIPDAPRIRFRRRFTVTSGKQLDKIKEVFRLESQENLRTEKAIEDFLFEDKGLSDDEIYDSNLIIGMHAEIFDPSTGLPNVDETNLKVVNLTKLKIKQLQQEILDSLVEDFWNDETTQVVDDMADAIKRTLKREASGEHWQPSKADDKWHYIVFCTFEYGDVEKLDDPIFPASSFRMIVPETQAESVPKTVTTMLTTKVNKAIHARHGDYVKSECYVRKEIYDEDFPYSNPLEDKLDAGKESFTEEAEKFTTDLAKRIDELFEKRNSYIFRLLAKDVAYATNLKTNK